ncbi:unnamed protein product [Diabrotica balteata]|uniref:Luc7-like protein 3 n=1 Tax=Diabrotica balteata TaxID=107213 RepID=A0A9N9STV7_DIABA|nr:unnamed protein product [Diabrotica balteata]
MAVTAAAQLLDELMGKNRNVAPDEKVKPTDWRDAIYCKYYLVKLCPHDLFVNTKNDLGTCPKIHDEDARQLFQEVKNTDQKKLQYHVEFLRFCASIMNDLERRIDKGKQRLALMSNSTEAVPKVAKNNQEQINILSQKIEELETQAEQAGIAGNVEHAQGILKLCDQLKEEKDALLKPADRTQNNNSDLTQEKQMEVCEVCGALLIVGDAQQRLEDHLMGKQHMGYSKLKEIIDEISQLVKDTRELLYGPRISEKRSREKDSRKERSRDRGKKKDRKYDMDYEQAKTKTEKDEDSERDRRPKDKSRLDDRSHRRDSHRDREHRDKERYEDRHRNRDREKRKHRDSSHHHSCSHRRHKK